MPAFQQPFASFRHAIKFANTAAGVAPRLVEQHASIGAFLDKDNWNADRRRGALKPDRHQPCR